MPKFRINDRVIVSNPSFSCYKRIGNVIDFNANGTPLLRFEHDDSTMHIRSENLEFFNGGSNDKYVLWQPESNRPPQVTYGSYGQALKVAKEMAQRHRKKFIICKLDTEVELSDFIINKL